MEVLQVLILYIVLINALAFLAMGIDKKRSAKRHKWRISEAAFFVMALFFGSIGCLCGMYLFHHKTMKPAFQYGMPAILILQILITLIVIFLSPLKFSIM